jgi:predicted dehydrogenase
MTTAARDTLAVGLVGYGLGGAAFHAPLIAATPGLRLAAVVTRNAERAATARRDHPGVRVVPDTDALWAMARELDVVVISTPNATHVPLARAALAAGLPVVVDKPLAATAREARALVAEAERHGLMLTTYQNRRWDGDFLTVRRLIADGALGRPLRFESRFDRWRPAARGGWREEGDPAQAGGLLYDLGSHLIDQALQLFGPATHVYAELDRRRPGVPTDDDSFVALTHDSGVRSHLWMGYLAAQPAARLRVLGDRAAYVKWSADPQEVALRAGQRPGAPGWGEDPPAAGGLLGAGDDALPVRTEAGAYQRFYEGVVRTLRDGAPPPVDPRDAITMLAVIEAAQRSAREARVVQP